MPPRFLYMKVKAMNKELQKKYLTTAEMDSRLRKERQKNDAALAFGISFVVVAAIIIVASLYQIIGAL